MGAWEWELEAAATTPAPAVQAQQPATVRVADSPVVAAPGTATVDDAALRFSLMELD